MPATQKKAPAKKPAPRRRRKIVRVSVKYFGLFTCKTCRRRYTLPWRHTCLLGFTAKEAAASRRNLELARKAKRRKGGR